MNDPFEFMVVLIIADEDIQFQNNMNSKCFLSGWWSVLLVHSKL